MPIINMLRACWVHLADNTKVLVPAGFSEQPDEVAKHWYVQHHLGPMPPAPTVQAPVTPPASTDGQTASEASTLASAGGQAAFKAEGDGDDGAEGGDADGDKARRRRKQAE